MLSLIVRVVRARAAAEGIAAGSLFRARECAAVSEHWRARRDMVGQMAVEFSRTTMGMLAGCNSAPWCGLCQVNGCSMKLPFLACDRMHATAKSESFLVMFTRTAAEADVEALSAFDQYITARQNRKRHGRSKISLRSVLGGEKYAAFCQALAHWQQVV